MINEGILHSDNDLEKNPVQPEINGEVYNIELEENKLNKENFAIKKEKIKEVEKKTSGENLVTFHEVSYSVEIKRKGVCCGKTKKIIIDKINGFFQQGMNAIMGPTGGGKSSLLDILAGRKDPKGLEGLVLVDGKKQPHDFNRKTAYVIQEDIVMGTLTVKENIMFSANLRLPKSLGHKEKSKRVEEIIRDLGLEKCANTKVGTQFIRGVSGGEKKRTNIAMEMIISPNILFLDEPTTGLDSFTSNSIMSLLHSLSLDGRTIIFSIHQPRYSIFKYFHRLTLISEGKLAYHGEASEALDFFRELGYNCETYDNPADFMLDTIKLNQKELELRVDPFREMEMDLNSFFLRSKWNTNLQEELEILRRNFIEKNEIKLKNLFFDSYNTGFFAQFIYLSKRSLRNWIRNPQSFFMEISINIIISIMVGLSYFQLNRNTTAADITLQNLTSAYFVIITQLMFSVLHNADLFIKDRVHFRHENMSGYYRTSTYFFSKIFCDVLPMRIINVTIFTVISYFMIGFNMNAEHFFVYFFSGLLTSLTASGVCFALSVSLGIHSLATQISTLIYVLVYLFCGVLSNLTVMEDWISWISYFSFNKFSLHVIFISLLKNLELKVNNGTEFYIDRTIGPNYLLKNGIKHQTLFDFWSNFLALGIYFLLLLLITYVQLRRIPRYN